MALGGFLRRLFAGPGQGRDVDELARRLGMSADELGAVRPTYREFTVAKRSGGKRVIAAPADDLKSLQRRILRRLLTRLESHPAVTGFVKGRSIVHNARPHVGKAIVVKMDIEDFFTRTTAKRVREYFHAIGWNWAACDLLVKLVTRKGGLPQGAPTSPRLSNLVNRRMDKRLAALAAKRGAVYTRYADDMTFSFAQDDGDAARKLVSLAGRIVAEEGYKIHTRKKLRIQRRSDRQVVTGLVVNERVNLPRVTRRALRAIEHHAATNRPITLTPQQLAGWRSFRAMVEAGR